MFTSSVDIAWNIGEVTRTASWQNWFTLCSECQQNCCTLCDDYLSVFSTTSLVADRTAIFQCCPLAAVHPSCTVSCGMHIWLCKGCRPKDVLCLNLYMHVETNIYIYVLTFFYSYACTCAPTRWMGLFGHRSLKRTLLWGNAYLCCNSCKSINRTNTAYLHGHILSASCF